MFLFAQIQLHDHSSVFGVAEVLFAIAAELSVCLCHITAQRLLKLLRDAAPRNDIAHAGIPHIHDAGPFTVLIGQKSGSPETHPQTVPPDTLPFAVCAPPEAHPALDSGHSQAVWIYTAGYAVSVPLTHCHSDRPSGVSRLHEYTITDKHPKNRNPAANPIPVNSFLKKPISHTSSGYSLA